MSNLKNSYSDLYREATQGGGGPTPTSLSSLNDANSDALNRNISLGSKIVYSSGQTDNIVLSNNPSANVSQMGNYNVFVSGANSVGSGATQNTGCGHGCLQDLTSGTANCAYGYNSLTNNTNGNYNTAMGSQSGELCSTGSGNVFLGFNSGVGHTTANNCVYIGQNTQNPSNYNSVIMIGKDITATQANSLFLPPALSTVSNSGNAKLMMFDTSSGKIGATDLSNTDGYLKNTSGVLSWSPLSASSIPFVIALVETSPITWTKGGAVVINFESIDYNNASTALTPLSSSQIQVAVAGYYKIEIYGNLSPSSSGVMGISFNVRKNITTLTPSNNILINDALSGEIYPLNSFIVNNFNVNDIINFQLDASTTPNTVGGCSGSVEQLYVKITKLT